MRGAYLHRRRWHLMPIQSLRPRERVCRATAEVCIRHRAAHRFARVERPPTENVFRCATDRTFCFTLRPDAHRLRRARYSVDRRQERSYASTSTHVSSPSRTRLAHRRRLRGMRHAAGGQICRAALRIISTAKTPSCPRKRLKLKERGMLRSAAFSIEEEIAGGKALYFAAKWLASTTRARAGPSIPHASARRWRP